jgi:methionyl-tRNA synthetase
MENYYLTTPIYYVNDKPHVGHAYTTIAADVLARYRRLRGDDVYFLTGTDENSQKNVEAAAKHGESDIKAYLDRMSTQWKETWQALDITFDDFIRTTEPRHLAGVEKFWKAVEATGDIYLGEYEGLYCTACEKFYTPGELVEGKCPDHKTEPKLIKEKNYFFKLSAYREKLLAHIDADPEFIMPVTRRNEVRSYVDKFMADVSISRESGTWGIPVPGHEGHVVYVWFDALINYLTGIGYGGDEAMFAKYWPADLHLVGKDIIKFHCALWPAMLMSAGLPLPKRVFAHGHFTVDGDKMSKSLGNVVNPVEIAATYGNDTLRYFLLREIPFGGDGDFSLGRLAQRYEGDLANDLGNLLHRTLSMTEKYFDGKVPAADIGDLSSAWEGYGQAMDALDFTAVLEGVWTLVRQCNHDIDAQKPWTLAKTDRVALAKWMYAWLERLRHVALMLLPIMPKVSSEILLQLGVAVPAAGAEYEKAKAWGGLVEGATIAKGAPLFPKKEQASGKA